MKAIIFKNSHYETKSFTLLRAYKVSMVTRQSMSFFIFFIIVTFFFSSSIAYGDNDIKEIINETKKVVKIITNDEEQPIDFLLRKTNEKLKDSNNKIDLPKSLKERLKKEFSNKLQDKRGIEADINKNPWYYFFCSNDKRNDLSKTFNRNFQAKKDIIECRNKIYKNFEAVKSFVEKIKTQRDEPKGKDTLIYEVYWLKEAFDIPKKFAEINEICITKEKYEPWSRNIPFFFDNDLEILERTKKAKGKIQKILNGRITKRLERVGELEKIMTDEFPETTDSFTTLKNILEKTSKIESLLERR